MTYDLDNIIHQYLPTTSNDMSEDVYAQLTEFIASDCINLTTVRPTDPSSFNVSNRVHREKSWVNITPPFHFGSQFGKGAAPMHMRGDIPYMNLISDYINKNYADCVDCITIDMGANQGFYTYFLAALGMQVHSFEINDRNFVSLKHGLLFNPTEVSKRVHLYPIGISDNIGWSSQRGSGYESYLDKTTTTGSILSITFDCFVHHTKPKLLNNIPFVKVDVEGYEIAAIKGTKHSLLHPSIKIGVWFMEVGPSRWDRAGVSLESGIEEMKDLASHFKETYIILRGSASKNCPNSIADDVGLSDTNPRKLDTIYHIENLVNHMHKVTLIELQSLLTHMHEHRTDCNFWFEN